MKTERIKENITENNNSEQIAMVRKRILRGIVLSDKMQKTIVVRVDRRVMHDQYKKYVTSSSKYKAHDEREEANVGDRVEIIESRPFSKEKRWALRKIVERAALAQ